MLMLNLIVATLAVTRITRLFTTDKITVGYRRWVINKWGAESWQSVLAHCDWCFSIWVSLIVIPAVVLLSGGSLLLAALSVPAASYVTGFLISKE
jgi:hypothetical protein